MTRKNRYSVLICLLILQIAVMVSQLGLARSVKRMESTLNRHSHVLAVHDSKFEQILSTSFSPEFAAKIRNNIHGKK